MIFPGKMVEQTVMQKSSCRCYVQVYAHHDATWTEAKNPRHSPLSKS